MTVRVPILSILYMLATFTYCTNWATILMLPTMPPTHINCASANVLQTTTMTTTATATTTAMTIATTTWYHNCASARPRALTTMPTVAAPRMSTRPRRTLALPRLLRAKGGYGRLNYCNSRHPLMSPVILSRALLQLLVPWIILLCSVLCRALRHALVLASHGLFSTYTDSCIFTLATQCIPVL